MEQRVRVNTGEQARERFTPIDHLNIAATAIGAAETVFTVRTGVTAIVERFSVANVTGAAATLNLHTVPTGGTAGNANAELIGFSVAANTALDLTDLIKGLYAAGTTFEVYASAAGALVVHGYVKELL